jgi:predicted O-methyltransferase YrrM
MTKGAILFSDDVLLFGWVSGEEETPQKRHSIVDKIKSYLNVLTADKDFITSVLNVGDGVALSVYQGKKEETKEK